MKTLKIFLLAVVVSTLWTACNKDNEDAVGGTTPVKVRMTDAPGNFQQVNVDITGVEFKVNSMTTVNLNVTPGIYNLLDFVNGIDTLIASADVPSGTLSQVRLILGPNNSVMVDSVVYPLSTPSAMQSGLKLNVHSTLVPGVLYELLLDFDANQSIVLQGNGEYQLKPVIRVISTATSGAIHGTIVTALALPAMISATDGNNTYTTVTDVNGSFLLRGLPAGTYTVTITPEAPYLPLTTPGVVVTVGAMTELGAILF
ncbi:MAG TPA: DUF4382 domain-containing protein [Bacteroidia bacterium]|nr:DUF4382 domain-containing protein [Bacteroidia bacterium]